MPSTTPGVSYKGRLGVPGNKHSKQRSMQNISREQAIMAKIKKEQGNIDLSRDQGEEISLEDCSRIFVTYLGENQHENGFEM